jgi:hypothetical protein
MNTYEVRITFFLIIAFLMGTGQLSSDQWIKIQEAQAKPGQYQSVEMHEAPARLPGEGAVTLMSE